MRFVIYTLKASTAIFDIPSEKAAGIPQKALFQQEQRMYRAERVDKILPTSSVLRPQLLS